MNIHQKFVEIYCATTILVIGQYFENPFSEENEIEGFKRPLNSFESSDDEEIEENFESKLLKKRKFSF
jgi:hypothetical protein